MSEPSQRKMRSIVRETVKTAGLVALLLLLMMWLAGTFVAKVEPAPPEPRQKPPAMKTVRVERKAVPLIINQVGSLRSRTEAQVSSRIMAQVREIVVREGDLVVGSDRGKEKATVLARLDDREIKAQLQQAKARVRAMGQALAAAQARLGAARDQVEAAKVETQRARADYLRYQDLYKSEAATGQKVEHMKAQMEIARARESAAMGDVRAAESDIRRIRAQKENAEAAEAGARVALNYTLIKAPFSGRVIKKMVDEGDMAAPGVPLFLLEVPSQPELRAFVSDSIMGSLRIGQELDVYIESLNAKYRGRLREITPKSDPATRTVLVKVSLPRIPDLVTGLYGRLAVPYGEYTALVVPAKTVYEVGQLHLVNVLSHEGYPERRFITVGREYEGMIEVLSGLKEGEEVVIHE